MPRSVPNVRTAMPWDEFIRLIEAYGFHVFWQREYETIAHGRQTQIVADHRRKKLLLLAESISGREKELWKAHAYGVIQSKLPERFKESRSVYDHVTAENEEDARIRKLGASYTIYWSTEKDLRLFVCVDLERGGIANLEQINRQIHFGNWELTENEGQPIELRSRQIADSPTRKDLWDQLQAAFPRRVRNFIYPREGK